MKKIIILTMLFCCLSFNASAKDINATAIIPDYQIVIDDSLVYYADSQYPFLNYKGITYLPMTYEYARAMDLTTGYLKGSAFMVAYQPSYDNLPVYETTYNKKYNTVVIPSYNIYVNAKKVDNENAEYPLLNFRGVTYFPMTWEYAVDNFGWELSFENNILKINTENNTADRWELIEKREKDAVMSLYYGKEIPQEDGSVEYDWITEYYSLDYKTGKTTKLDDYVLEEKELPLNTQVELTVKDGHVHHKEQRLDGIYIEEEYVKSENAEEAGYSLTAFTSEIYAPLKVVDVNVHTYNYGENGNWGRKENYTFIDVNDTLVLLGKYRTVENVYTLGEDIYFNTVDYGQTIFRHYLNNRKMWKLSKDGTLEEIKYAMYNSIKIIGKANDELYLKCLWSPENHMDDAPYSVSLVNDGYHTWDGQGIRFISPYIYSDFDIVSDEGDIIAVNNKTDKIVRCEINPQYY